MPVHAPPAHLANRRIAVAFSGGGLRATLFHLGTICGLRRLGVLRQIQHVTGVSGGSIVAAHLGLKWHDYVNPHPSVFRMAVEEVVKAAKSGIRERIMRRLALNMTSFLFPFRKRYVLPLRTQLLSQMLDESIFKGALFRSLARDSTINGDFRTQTQFPESNLSGNIPPRPRIDILASDLISANMCSFSTHGFYFPKQIASPLVRHIPFTIADVVAISAAYPLFFPPANLMPRDFQAPVACFDKFKQLSLSDGGIYDNLGVQWLLDVNDQIEVANRADLVVVSNASQDLDWASSHYKSFISRTIGSPKRAVDLLYHRIHELSVKPKDKSVTYVNISDKTCNRSTNRFTAIGNDGFFPESLTTITPFLRTDFDSFSEMEAAALVTHGFFEAFYSVGDWDNYPAELPKFLSAIRAEDPPDCHLAFAKARWTRIYRSYGVRETPGTKEQTEKPRDRKPNVVTKWIGKIRYQIIPNAVSKDHVVVALMQEIFDGKDRWYLGRKNNHLRKVLLWLLSILGMAIFGFLIWMIWLLIVSPSPKD